MYIKSVKVQGIRGFADNRSVDLDLMRSDGRLAGLTVLAGRNGSGKTTLLRAIALAIAGPAVSRNLVADFESWINDASESGKVEVQLAFDSAVDGFTGGGRLPVSKSLWVGLQWDRSNEDRTLPLRRIAQPVLRQAIDRNRTERKSPDRGPWSENPVGWFLAAYGPFRRLVGGTTEVQRLMMSPTSVARLVTLFHEDASLAEGVSWLVDQRLRAFEKRSGAQELLDNALAILGDGLLPDEYNIADVNADGLVVTRHGTPLALREMSDGFRTVVALVVDILHQLFQSQGMLEVSAGPDGRPVVNAPGVVLIDELDVHLHVSWQKKIGGWLKDHFPMIQFVTTTHSPYICQSADERGLIRLPGINEPGGPTVVSDDLYQRVIYGSGDDATVSELFGLDTPYSQQAEAVRRRLVQLEEKIIDGTATEEEQEEYAQKSDMLSSSLLTRVEEVAAQLVRP